MKFQPFQNRWITDKSRLKLLVKSRRIGGSFGTSYWVFQRLMSIPNHDVTVITRDMLTVTEFVRDVQKFAKAWNLTNPSSLQIPKECMTKMQFSIPHRGGASRLIAVSSNPDAAAGKGGDLIIDEMALHQDQELLLTVATPVITAGGTLSILSTHRSKSSLFNKYVQDAEAGLNKFSVHKTTMVDAIEEGFVDLVVNPQRIKLGLEEISNEEYLRELRDDIVNDSTIWDQEFMCIPSEQQYTLIIWELICRQASNEQVYRDRKTDGIRYLGWDIAESEFGDYSVITVLEKRQNHLYLIDHQYIEKGTELPEQRELLYNTVKKFAVSRIALDATGIGRDSWRILQRKYGEHMVEGIVFGMGNKAEMAGKMLSLFQSGDLWIPHDDQLMNDINSVEKIYSKAGNVTYRAHHQDGSHGDGFWSLAMAALVATAPDRLEITVPKGDAPEHEYLSKVERNREADSKGSRSGQFTL